MGNAHETAGLIDSLPCGGRARVEPGLSVQLNLAVECKEGLHKEFGEFMRSWVKHNQANPPMGNKVMAFAWANGRRCLGTMIFDSDLSLQKFKDTAYAEMMRSVSPYLSGKDTTVDDYGRVSNSRSRKEIEDGLNFVRIWSYTCKEGKENEMREYWTKEFSNLAYHDIDWMMYSFTNPTPRRWCFAMAYRNGPLCERASIDERKSVESGPLSHLVAGGAAVYDFFWAVEGVSYPH